MFLGAGEAGTGIASLLATAISEESNGKVSVDEALEKIWLVDSKGTSLEGSDTISIQTPIEFIHHARIFIGKGRRLSNTL